MSEKQPNPGATVNTSQPGALTRQLARLGHFFFKLRDGLFPVVFLVLAFGFAPRLAGGDAALDRLLDLVGLAVAALGQGLRAVVIGFVYIVRGGRDRQVYADDLVSGGFFAHCRNPLYVGNLLVLFGLLIVHNSVWVYAIGVPFYLLAYVSITLAEEDYLSRRFGAEYDAYRASVPRFWIRWSGLRETLQGLPFDWRKLIRKEYGSTFSWVTSAFVLIAWQAVSSFGWEAARSEVTTLGVVWLPVLAAYLLARMMKKTGRLGRD